MQVVLLNIAIIALLVFLFGIVSSVRPDDRLRCWFAGWTCIMVHFGADLWTPSNAAGEAVRTCLSIGPLFLAGICFLVSTMILTQGRKAGIRLLAFLTCSFLVCFGAAVIAPDSYRILTVLVVTRMGVTIFMAFRDPRNRPLFTSTALAVCAGASAWMLYGLMHGQSETVIYALLVEIYLVAALDFWNCGWPRTLALHTVGVGLVAWAAVFPVALLVQHFWPSFAVEPAFWNTPKICVAIGMILVVLEEDTRAAQSLTEEYRLLFDSNPHPLWIFETATLQFLGVNKAALDLHGYTREEFLRLKLTDIIEPSMAERVRREVASPKPSPNRASRHIRKDGSLLPMDITAYSTVFQGKTCRFVLGIDVREREELEVQLERQAQHDFLTGLPNRLLFKQRLVEAVDEAVKRNEMVAILGLDIIRLKAINDTYGLRVGDECVKRAASILGQCARSQWIVARTGGGEFAIALGGIKSAAAAEQTIIEIRKAFSQPVQVQGYKIQLSLSMGLAVSPDDGTDASALWRHAESAQRSSRAAGGNEAVWFSPELNLAAEEQIEIEAYLRLQLQLEVGGFYLAYQPFYGFDGAVHGLEALLRLDHPTHGALSPAKFIPIAEETGLINEIGQRVLQEVCRQIRVWKDQGVPIVPVAVNVSGLQLMRIDFAQQVMEALQRYAIDPQWIHLEVTETTAMQDTTAVAEKMAALSAIGIQFSIDDFGTGHSSLGRLHELPIAELKIDRSFVDQLCVTNGTLSIVQAVVSMAHALGHRVVAEGVETEEQLLQLRALHCDLLQGFLLARPVAPERVPALIAGRNQTCSYLSGAMNNDRLQPPGPKPRPADNAQVMLSAGIL